VKQLQGKIHWSSGHTVKNNLAQRKYDSWNTVNRQEGVAMLQYKIPEMQYMLSVTLGHVASPDLWNTEYYLWHTIRSWVLPRSPLEKTLLLS